MAFLHFGVRSRPAACVGILERLLVCSLVPDPYQQGRYQHAAYGTRRPQRQARRPTRQILRWWRSPALGLPGRRKRWRLAYRAGGLQKLLAIGVNPEVGLKDAREAREAAKKIPAGGGDPMAVKASQGGTRHCIRKYI